MLSGEKVLACGEGKGILQPNSDTSNLATVLEGYSTEFCVDCSFFPGGELQRCDKVGATKGASCVSIRRTFTKPTILGMVQKCKRLPAIYRLLVTDVLGTMGSVSFASKCFGLRAAQDFYREEKV